MLLKLWLVSFALVCITMTRRQRRVTDTKHILQINFPRKQTDIFVIYCAYLSHRAERKNSKNTLAVCCRKERVGEKFPGVRALHISIAYSCEHYELCFFFLYACIVFFDSWEKAANIGPHSFFLTIFLHTSRSTRYRRARSKTTNLGGRDDDGIVFFPAFGN